jgi:hypothetical protein
MVFCIENQDSKASNSYVTRANRANILKSPLKSTRINLKTPQISLQNPNIYIFELISRCQMTYISLGIGQLNGLFA